MTPKYFDPVIDGMAEVFTSGTAYFLNVPGIEICGKTGTAENYTKINGVRTQLTDHSIFYGICAKRRSANCHCCFCREWILRGRAGHGRISSLMIEKYIKGNVTLKAMEALVLKKSLEDEYHKPISGKPFKINQ